MLLTLALTLVVIDPETPPLWGDLEPGRHAVGFRSRELRDLSRLAIAGGIPGRRVLDAPLRARVDRGARDALARLTGQTPVGR